MKPKRTTNILPKYYLYKLSFMFVEYFTRTENVAKTV